MVPGNRRRGIECRLWRSFQRFVDQVPYMSLSDGTAKVLKRLAIWWILGVAVCFKTASTRQSKSRDEAWNDYFWNTGHTTSRLFQNGVWRCADSFVTRRWTGYFWNTRQLIGASRCTLNDMQFCTSSNECELINSLYLFEPQFACNNRPALIWE